MRNLREGGPVMPTLRDVIVGQLPKYLAKISTHAIAIYTKRALAECAKRSFTQREKFAQLLAGSEFQEVV